MRTAIVIVADDNHLPAACCVVISCRYTGHAREPIFLIVSNGSDRDLHSAQAFLEQLGASAEILCPSIDLSSYRIDRWISPASYIRLHLDTILDGHWQRVLYLDADTRITARLQPLLSADLRGRPLGSVDNIYYENHSVRLSMAEESPYFNSGVLLFDWPAVLSGALLAEARHFARTKPYLCDFWDQDALNKVFEGLWTPLDLRWNFARGAIERLPTCRAFIKHYTGKNKPWSAQKMPCWFADAMWYRRILRKSPWPDFAQPVTLHDVLEACRWYRNTRSRDRRRYRLADNGLHIEAIC